MGIEHWHPAQQWMLKCPLLLLPTRFTEPIPNVPLPAACLPTCLPACAPDQGPPACRHRLRVRHPAQRGPPARCQRRWWVGGVGGVAGCAKGMDTQTGKEGGSSRLRGALLFAWRQGLHVSCDAFNMLELPPVRLCTALQYSLCRCCRGDYGRLLCPPAAAGSIRGPAL